MAFHLTTLRLSYAIKAYQTHMRLTGQPARRIRQSLSRREAGNWHLSDGKTVVAVVSSGSQVRIND